MSEQDMACLAFQTATLPLTTLNAVQQPVAAIHGDRLDPGICSEAYFALGYGGEVGMRSG